MQNNMTNDFCGTVLYFISFKEINMVDLAHCLKNAKSSFVCWLRPAGQCLLSSLSPSLLFFYLSNDDGGKGQKKILLIFVIFLYIENKH